MAVSLRSFRQGDWKLTFNRGLGSSGPDDLNVDQASLYNLADDLGETQDLSQSQPERKQQLFAAYREYFAKRKLKPLAIEVAERKQAAKSRKQTAPKREKRTRQESSKRQQNAKLNK